MFKSKTLVHVEWFRLRLWWNKSINKYEETWVWDSRQIFTKCNFGVIGLSWFRCKEEKAQLFNYLVCHNFKWSIGILIDQIKPLFMERKEIWYWRKIVAKIIFGVFGISSFWCKDQIYYFSRQGVLYECIFLHRDFDGRIKFCLFGELWELESREFVNFKGTFWNFRTIRFWCKDQKVFSIESSFMSVRFLIDISLGETERVVTDKVEFEMNGIF